MKVVDEPLGGGTLLTIEQVAERLHIGRSTVWRLLKDEGLPSVKIGRRRLVRAKDLDAWIGSKVEGSEDSPG